MLCIYCGGETQVTNSRLQKKANWVWRRRECSKCSGVFTTLEQADLATSLLYKTKTGHFEPFSRDKLFLSIYNSLKHRKTSPSDATSLTATVMVNLSGHIKDATIQRDDIIRVTTEVLKRFDRSASTAYDAYHPV